MDFENESEFTGIDFNSIEGNHRIMEFSLMTSHVLETSSHHKICSEHIKMKYIKINSPGTLLYSNSLVSPTN